MSICLLGLAHEPMLMGLAHVRMLMGLAHVLILVGRAYEPTSLMGQANVT